MSSSSKTSIKFTPTPTEISPKEKENVPANSIFHNFLSLISPKKLVAPFARSSESNIGQKRSSLSASSKNSSSSADYTGINNGFHELRELCAQLRRESPFVRKVAQILRRSTLAPVVRKDESVAQFLLHSAARLPKGRRRKTKADLGLLERTVVRLKHAQSAKLRADSLTFEFFNTIAPLYAGPAHAQFDVFLCAVDTKRQKVHHWDSVLTFVSPMNQTKRANRVLEVWIPGMDHSCDQLFLVVEGQIVEEKSNKDAMAHKVIAMLKNGSVKRKHSLQFEENLSIKKKRKTDETTILCSSTRQRKITFRGIKVIGTWQEDGPAQKVFQPIFTHNGMLLNIFDGDEKPMSAQKRPKYDMVENLVEKNKTYGKGTCNMLQMEVSNEHGYGGVVVETETPKMGKPIQSPSPMPLKHIIKKYYFIDGTVDSSTAQIFHVPKWLKSMPSPVQMRCIFCKCPFAKVWPWAVHLVGMHPSLHFKFIHLEQENCEGEGIIVEIRKMPFDIGRHQNKILIKKMALSLRANILTGYGRRNNHHNDNGNANNCAKTPEVHKPADVGGKTGGKIQNSGKRFKGVLPFNSPNYTELKDPPFAHLHGVDSDQCWLRDSYSVRLGQFTDVSTNEQAFFLLWNSFISRRPNRQLGFGQFPLLLNRFIDEFGQKLFRLGLMANFLFHCSTLAEFGYISHWEMDKALDFAMERWSTEK